MSTKTHHNPRRIRRFVGGVACIAALTAAAPASAQGPEPALLDHEGDTLVYAAGAGANNAVTLGGAISGAEVVVADPGAGTIRYRLSLCDEEGELRLSCAAGPDGTAVFLGDGDDSLTVEPSYPADLPLRVECGSGDDRVEVPAGSAVATDCEVVNGATCAVPRVRKMTLRRARARLTKAGCGVRVRRAYSAKVRRGRVIKASARPGTRLYPGAPVTLTVSKGRRSV
jgi:hypothetical protein